MDGVEKKGALMEFNGLLLGEKKTSYSIKSQDMNKVPRVKYVITIDADTILPLGVAKRLIGAMAHPNKPVVNGNKGVVTEDMPFAA